jgi:hypothetical protein
MRTILLLCLLSLIACGRRGPESQQIPRGQALRWNEPMQGEVVKVWDGLHHSRDPHVTHLLEVRIEEGPESFQGQVICFPYDEWSCGKPPPREGSTTVFMPSAWLAVKPESMGRPRYR